MSLANHSSRLRTSSGLPSARRLVAMLSLTACILSAQSVESALGYDLRVGAAAEELVADDTMPIYSGGRSRGQDAPLRAIAVVIEKPGVGRMAVISCDVLNMHRTLLDPSAAEIAATCGIPIESVLISATHTHHAPPTHQTNGAPPDPVFVSRLGQAIVRSAQRATALLSSSPARLEFFLGEESRLGQNSRLLLSDNTVYWVGPRTDAIRPTGPIDPDLPVLVFRGPEGKARAVIYNHSCHTIGTRLPGARSPGFYGVAAQELESEIGAPICFLEGASGSTHNYGMSPPVPFDEAVARLKSVLRQGFEHATPRPATRFAAAKRSFSFKIRKYDEAGEEAAVASYVRKRYSSPQEAERTRARFAERRRTFAHVQGEERSTWIQALVVGDVAIVGLPGEFFTKLGLQIKQRSPFRNTFIAELANDYVGYLPDQDAFKLGGYQTWMAGHSYSERDTGERMVDAAVELLDELFKNTPSTVK